MISIADVPVGDPGEFIGALPWVLGFYPSNSVVIATTGCDGKVAKIIEKPLRVDGGETAEWISMLIQLRLVPGAKRVYVAMFAAADGSEGTGAASREITKSFTAAARKMRLSTAFVAWAATALPGGAWSTLRAGGSVEPPADASIARRSRGSFPYPSREAFAASLGPCQPAADELAGRLSSCELPLNPATAMSTIVSITRDVFSGYGGDVPAYDCLRALADPLAYRRALRRTVVNPQLMGPFWKDMVRAVSGPERGRPAAMLAAAAHLSGDGALAGIAIEVARRSLPQDQIAQAIYTAVHLGLPAADFKEFTALLIKTEQGRK